MTHRLVHLVALLAFVLTCLSAGLAGAQFTQEQRDTYDEWIRLADRAEGVIDASRASNAALEVLRADIVEYRELFAATREENSARIRTLQLQLDALGPPPAEGETEPEDLAVLRGELDTQLEALRVPRVLAEQAHNRADGLIGEIDRIMRERRTQQVLARGPTPLNPAVWPEAMTDMVRLGETMVAEVQQQWATASATSRAELRENALAIFLLGALGLLLLIRGGRWAKRFVGYLRGMGGQGTGVWTFIGSLLRIALPFLGIVFLTMAMVMTDALGLRGTLLLQALPGWGAILLAFNWLADRILARVREDSLEMPSWMSRATFRGSILTLAGMIVLHQALALVSDLQTFSPETRAALAFPPILVSALLLLRLHRVGAPQNVSAEAEDGDEDGHANRPGALIEGARKIALILALVSPVLAAAGYVAAAEALIYPAIWSLALIAALLQINHFFGDLYGWLTRIGEEGRDSLFSVIMGFLLTLVSLPVFALIWGARWSDLTEAWTRMMAGISIGDTQVSPASFLTFAVIFAAGYTATRLLQGGLRNSLLPKTRIDPGGQNAIVSGTGYIGIVLATLAAISSAGLNLSSLAIVAGALSVGIGFGLQTIVSNFVSGIILLIERPISKGDWIEVGGQMGYVRDISVRSTRIETFDRSDVIVPNSDLISNTVTNFTRGNTIGRVILSVGVAYGTDTRHVERVLREIAEAHPMVLANPAPFIYFKGFGADSLDFEIRAILRDVNWSLLVRTDLNHEIAKRFAEEGIEVPFRQTDIWLRNPEALMQAGEHEPPQMTDQPLASPVPKTG